MQHPEHEELETDEPEPEDPPASSPMTIGYVVTTVMLVLGCTGMLVCSITHSQDRKALEVYERAGNLEHEAHPFVAPKNWDEENRPVETPADRPNLYRI